MHLRTPQVSQNFAVLLTLKANDHVILPDDVYGTFRLLEEKLANLKEDNMHLRTPQVSQFRRYY